MMQIFPYSVDLEITRSLRLHAHQSAVLYATFAAAQGLAESTGDHYPDGLLFTPLEQSRLHWSKGDCYRLGLTVLAADPQSAAARMRRFLGGLRKHGTTGTPADRKLGGNFQVRQVMSLVDQSLVQDRTLPIAIPDQFFAAQVEQLRPQKEITIRLITPLRCERPRALREDGGTFLNEKLFLPHVFLRRARRRLRDLGFSTESHADDSIDASVARVESSEVLWIDLSYGKRRSRKALGGIVGDIRLRLKSPQLLETLILAQFVAVGEKTRWGFGQFRIVELDPAALLPKRSTSLLTLAMNRKELMTAAEKKNLPSGVIGSAVERVLSREYEPSECRRFILPASKPDSQPRLMCVPAPIDHVLQTAVMRQIAPALDLFFEESSLAYRRGLGRQRAATRLRQAYQDGFEWAVRSDIHRFFDSVNHQLLKQRLDAFLRDPPTVELIMIWVTSSSPVRGRGLPTGSPISPLLANLFLDRFDEMIESEGGHLVRYADDFLILFRQQQDADPILQAARNAASQLRLHLNRDKTSLVHLKEPFSFLGYRFEHQDAWEFHPESGVIHVNDLGWTQQQKRTPPPALAPLPGESDKPIEHYASTVIAGPGISWVGIRKNRLIVESRDGRTRDDWPLTRVDDLILIGSATLDRSLFISRRPDPLTVWMTSPMGMVTSVMVPERPLDNAVLLKAQFRAADKPAACLHIARKLVIAKLHNYAALARTTASSRHAEQSSQLMDLARSAATAETLEQLNGFEGNGASLWYRSFSTRLNSRFKFTKRTAPDASDPVNVLLNIGFSWVYRMAESLLLSEGLAPSTGFLHQTRSGHSALASDIMEPFRHLVDRAVILATEELSPRDFSPGRGYYRIEIHPAAMRRFLLLIQTTFQQSVTGNQQTEPRSYQQQLMTTIRGLHRHLLNEKAAFHPFQHPR